MRRLAPIWLIVVPLTTGCYTGARNDDDASDDDDNASGGGGGHGDDGAPEPFCEDEVMPEPTPRLVRLTHVQYDNTIRDLLGVDASPSSGFLDDPLVEGFDNNASALFVSDRLARDYRRAAEELAASVTADEELWQVLVPCDPQEGSECAATFIEHFGRRTYRRPLDEDEVKRYLDLFEQGEALYDDGSSFARGVRLVVEAMLQSPHFLYRLELSSEAQDGNVVALTGWEIASRLSYLLWSSAPDDALLDAAEAGELDTPEGVAEEARRLLADSRSAATVDDFHRQWLELDKLGDITKDPELFPEWTPDVTDGMREEVVRFIRRVVFDLEGSYTDLMSLPETYVDADLAALYGLDGGFGDAMELVELDPAERAGLLTRIGFLSSHAFPGRSSPIRRGVFVQRRILCTPIPPPPGDVDTTLPPVEGEIETTREAVELHTSPDACRACHGLINEPGFAFEIYDAAGRFRETENGVPIDAAGQVLLDGENVSFDDGVELSHAIADSETGPLCYATQWFRYANMRQETPDDQCTLEGLHTAWEASGYDVQELLVALTQTASFRYRAAWED